MKTISYPGFKVIEKKGDLLDLDANIICHQVNCLGIMGGGIALQIKKKWPLVFEQYKEYCDKHIEAPEEMLGKAFMSPADGRWVANIFSQFGVGTDQQQTDYASIEEGIKDLFTWICKSRNALGNEISIGIPKNYGCGLGGGDWNIVESIFIKEMAYYASKCKIDLTLYIVEWEG